MSSEYLFIIPTAYKLVTKQRETFSLAITNTCMYE